MYITSPPSLLLRACMSSPYVLPGRLGMSSSSMPISHSIALPPLGRAIITKPANRGNGPVLRPGCVPPLYHRSAGLTPLRSFMSRNELPREDFPARRGCAQVPSCLAALLHLHMSQPSARRVSRKLGKSRRGCSLRCGVCGSGRPRGARREDGTFGSINVGAGGRVRRVPSASCAIVRRGSYIGWHTSLR